MDRTLSKGDRTASVLSRALPSVETDETDET